MFIQLATLMQKHPVFVIVWTSQTTRPIRWSIIQSFFQNTVSPNFHWQKSLSTVCCNLTHEIMVTKMWQFPSKFHWPSFLSTMSVKLAWTNASFTDNKIVDCMCDKLHWQGEWWGTFISSQHLHATLTCWWEANVNQAKPS